eukprot:g2802.t1
MDNDNDWTDLVYVRVSRHQAGVSLKSLKKAYILFSSENDHVTTNAQYGNAITYFLEEALNSIDPTHVETFQKTVHAYMKTKLGECTLDDLFTKKSASIDVASMRAHVPSHVPFVVETTPIEMMTIGPEVTFNDVTTERRSAQSKIPFENSQHLDPNGAVVLVPQSSDNKRHSSDVHKLTNSEAYVLRKIEKKKKKIDRIKKKNDMILEKEKKELENLEDKLAKIRQSIANQHATKVKKKKKRKRDLQALSVIVPMSEYGRVIRTLEGNVMVKKGEMLVFKSDFIHSGHEYFEQNKMLFFHLDPKSKKTQQVMNSKKEKGRPDASRGIDVYPGGFKSYENYYKNEKVLQPRYSPRERNQRRREQLLKCQKLAPPPRPKPTWLKDQKRSRTTSRQKNTKQGKKYSSRNTTVEQRSKACCFGTSPRWSTKLEDTRLGPGYYDLREKEKLHWRGSFFMESTSREKNFHSQRAKSDIPFYDTSSQIKWDKGPKLRSLRENRERDVVIRNEKPLPGTFYRSNYYSTSSVGDAPCGVRMKPPPPASQFLRKRQLMETEEKIQRESRMKSVPKQTMLSSAASKKGSVWSRTSARFANVKERPSYSDEIFLRNAKRHPESKMRESQSSRTDKTFGRDTTWSKRPRGLLETDGTNKLKDNGRFNALSTIAPPSKRIVGEWTVDGTTRYHKHKKIIIRRIPPLSDISQKVVEEMRLKSKKRRK